MDLINICRTCLRIPVESIDLFLLDECVLNKIEVIASIKIELINNVSNIICKDCFKNINNCYNFRKLIINTDNDVRLRLETLSKTSSLTKRRNIIYNGTRNNSKDNHVLNEDKIVTTVGNNLPDEETFDYSIISYIKDKRKQVECPVCKKKLRSKYAFNMHKKAHIKRTCNVCGLSIRKDNFNKHVSLHSDKPETCDICGKILKNKETLRAHKFQHKDEFFKCKECKKTFNVKLYYKRHLRKHKDPNLGKKTCTICTKKYTHLDVHMRSHTGEKPHICRYCNKGFTTRYSMRVHVRIHTNEKPYVCEHCGNAFTQTISLRMHLKNKHGKK